MSLIESPQQTFRKFSQTSGWENASLAQLENDFFSISNETNLRWDQFVYEDLDGRLHDPIRGFIRGSAHGNEVEENVNKQLEDWFNVNDSGIAIWISPRGGTNHEPYPEEKITIYKIAYEITGKKVLLGASHQFKRKFSNPEDLRRHIFTEEDKDQSILDILEWLTKVSEKEVQKEVVNVSNARVLAREFAEKYISGVSVGSIIEEMVSKGFLGTNPISCGAAGTQDGTLVFLGNEAALDETTSEGGSYVRNCGNCGVAINSFISRGYKCGSCGGTYEGC